MSYKISSNSSSVKGKNNFYHLYSLCFYKYHVPQPLENLQGGEILNIILLIS